MELANNSLETERFPMLIFPTTLTVCDTAILDACNTFPCIFSEDNLLPNKFCVIMLIDTPTFAAFALDVNKEFPDIDILDVFDKLPEKLIRLADKSLVITFVANKFPFTVKFSTFATPDTSIFATLTLIPPKSPATVVMTLPITFPTNALHVFKFPANKFAVVKFADSVDEKHNAPVAGAEAAIHLPTLALPDTVKLAMLLNKLTPFAVKVFVAIKR
ncbi:hypothetical protein PBCV1_a019R [Paramecium bursaria Chlorella virus 1]|uniref:Uncharacterized protein n=1 Tax=Paramecium bursaria Chlorella virus 1 TaxID=10506 RepID=Q89354_PBCV1|nr:hypothetical protein PBCV1_a019R [Paramecium bursaria Chlorella virus 1]AAC96387.1 hypothetical protein [Paramecium bursaria Chlorella virus 1]